MLGRTGNLLIAPALAAAQTGDQPDNSTAQPILDALADTKAVGDFFIGGETDHTSLAKHLAFTLGAVRIEEGAMNASRLIADGVGHQCDNDAFMPAKAVVERIKQTDMQATPLSEIAPA